MTSYQGTTKNERRQELLVLVLIMSMLMNVMVVVRFESKHTDTDTSSRLRQVLEDTKKIVPPKRAMVDKKEEKAMTGGDDGTDTKKLAPSKRAMVDMKERKAMTGGDDDVDDVDDDGTDDVYEEADQDGTIDKDRKTVSRPARSVERSFLEIASKTLTDKVLAHKLMKRCEGVSLDKKDMYCTRPECKRKECVPAGHFYDTMYQSRLGKYSTDDAEPFQFLEIGFYNGRGFDAYTEFLPRAELHSMEIACLPEGPRKEGKWPFGNFAAKSPRYKELREAKRLHCGDASNINWLNHIWTTEMNRTDSPPLKIVVDDGAHLDWHMAQSVLFWLPRIEPGGLMIVEDIQPISEANKFRTQFLPQIMADLHYCGDPQFPDNGPCFPTLMPLMQSIHCEMHICIFERNQVPTQEWDLELSKLPHNALDLSRCPTFQSAKKVK